MARCGSLLSSDLIRKVEYFVLVDHYISEEIDSVRVGCVCICEVLNPRSICVLGLMFSMYQSTIVSSRFHHITMSLILYCLIMSIVDG